MSEQSAWALYRAIGDAMTGYLDHVPDDETMGGVRIDGDLDVVALAAAIEQAGAEHRQRMRDLVGKTPWGGGYLASEDDLGDERFGWEPLLEEWLAEHNAALRRARSELEALERVADGSMFGLFRVRMTSHGEGAPIADREMRAVPRVGDYVNAASGELIVDEVHWNTDPSMPCDVVLFMVSP